MIVEFERGAASVFENIGDTSQAILDHLETCVKKETVWLAHHEYVPHPYDSGVHYHLEEMIGGKRRERWQRIRTTLRQGWGDCEDLAIYLAAWIRSRMGIKATVGLIEFTDGVHRWYHAIVRLPSGRVIDPSRALGM